MAHHGQQFLSEFDGQFRKPLFRLVYTGLRRVVEDVVLVGRAAF
jgi:hypothetical protein